MSASKSKSQASISMSINGRSFHFEGSQAECNAKLDEFMREVFSPLHNAMATAFGTRRGWREVLGIKGATPTLRQVNHRFRVLARKHHPDKGGDRNKFEEIVQARDAARLELAS